MERTEAWWSVADGLQLRVRVTPRGGRDAVEGVETLSDGRAAVKARVRAAPEGGAANEALRRVLAKALGCPPSAVALQAGATTRIKTFCIRGKAAALGAALAQAIEGASQRARQ
jgi:uncharacterized protein